MRYAAIDTGSNTIRLLIAEPASAAATLPWKTIHCTHRIARLAEGLHHSHNLSDDGMARAKRVLIEFSQRLSDFGVPVENTLVAATAAVREARNGDAFRQNIKSETGLDIQVISGEVEAATSLAGSCAVLEAKIREDMLLFDIGGGSTEFIRAINGSAQDACSRKLGTVRLVDSCLHSDPPSAADYDAMLQIANEHLAAVESGWGDRRLPNSLVGTAGTVTTLAATELNLFPYQSEIINNHQMGRKAFFSLRRRLLGMSHQERLQVRTIESGRCDLMIAGLAIIEAIIERWDYDGFIVTDAGLLEGLWLRASQSK